MGWIDRYYKIAPSEISLTLRILGMSWGVKVPPVLRPIGLSLGGSGVSIGGGDGFLGHK